MEDNVISWLLEDSNPAVQHRSRKELLLLTDDNTKSKEWILRYLPDNWQDANGLWYGYYITALAECGLTHTDLSEESVEKAFQKMETFDCSCESFMLLSALVKLGYAEKPVLSQALASLPAMQLPDGGFLCSSRLAKLSYTPKSCYKANLHALLLLAACHKRGIDAAYGPPLLAYFWNHHLFYKESEKDTLILDSREGWRTIDTFHPFEAMRVGLHTVVEAFAALRYGRDERLGEAWSLLSQHKDTEGKYRLKGTLSKSYLPKEKAERPSKWVTFYALLAQKEAQNCL